MFGILDKLEGSFNELFDIIKSKENYTITKNLLIGFRCKKNNIFRNMTEYTNSHVVLSHHYIDGNLFIRIDLNDSICGIVFEVKDNKLELCNPNIHCIVYRHYCHKLYKYIKKSNFNITIDIFDKNNNI